MSIEWELVSGDILTLQLNYEVLNTRHKLQFFLQVRNNETIVPEELAQILGTFFIEKTLSNCLSQNSRWRSVTLIFSKGKVKIPFNVIGTGGLDMENMLRVSLNRYNKDYPLYFLIYGVQKNIDQSALDNAMKEIGTNSIEITNNLSVMLVGFANNAQITEQNYVVDVSSTFVKLSEKQKERLAKLAQNQESS